jgi:hypothetical protein
MVTSITSVPVACGVVMLDRPAGRGPAARFERRRAYRRAVRRVVAGHLDVDPIDLHVVFDVLGRPLLDERPDVAVAAALHDDVVAVSSAQAAAVGVGIGLDDQTRRTGPLGPGWAAACEAVLPEVPTWMTADAVLHALAGALGRSVVPCPADLRLTPDGAGGLLVARRAGGRLGVACSVLHDGSPVAVATPARRPSMLWQVRVPAPFRRTPQRLCVVHGDPGSDVDADAQMRSGT